MQHDLKKHIEIDRHFIKEKLDSGLICTPYVPTRHQLENVLTKGLCTKMFHKNISKLGMRDLYSLACGGKCGNNLILELDMGSE